jgi:CRISPR-associated protein Csh1
MIKELLQFTKNLPPEAFDWGVKLSSGLHVVVDFDSEGKRKGIEYVFNLENVLDADSRTTLMNECRMFEKNSTYIPSPPPSTMNKAFDKEIYSCSPFVFACRYKIEQWNEKPDTHIKKKKVAEYFEKSETLCLSGIEPDLAQALKIRIAWFKEYVENEFWEDLKTTFKTQKKKGKEIIELTAKDLDIKKDYIAVYLRQSEDEYQKVHFNYLADRLLNKGYDIGDYGLSSFFTTFDQEKLFLKHQTGFQVQGINSRTLKDNATLLFKFDSVKNNLLPNPLPLIIQLDELRKDEGSRILPEDLITIFKENGKMGYHELISQVFDKTSKCILSDYYLLYFSRDKIYDFDFVNLFRFELTNTDASIDKGWKILNLLGHKKKDGTPFVYNWTRLETIFDFENLLNEKFFYTIANKTGYLNPFLKRNYFGDIDAPKGHELRAAIQHNLLTYRKALYDYIYKSRTEALDKHFWYTLGLSTILDEIKTDTSPYKNDYRIKEKLNIWFSLNHHFDPHHSNFNGQDMKSKIPDLLDRMRQVADTDNEHFQGMDEFAFGAGQVIYFLFAQSEAGEKTHAVLEAFVQRQKISLLQGAVCDLAVKYKHAVGFGHRRFNKLFSEVSGWGKKEDGDGKAPVQVNMLDYLPSLLAGYFATNILFESKKSTSNL